MTRRQLLVSASACIANGIVARALSTASDDLDFASALDAAAAIKAKQVSSVELTRRIFARIDKYNPKLNAFTYEMRDQALVQARQADAALMKSGQVGPFHGVPICVKESFGVKGEPDTWGIVAFKESKAPQNSNAVQRLLNAGAVLVGGTNVPLNLMDWQSFNDIYGTTNNPWDLTRTPGGSSGGSAAALAAGLSYLSVGSDIGGSLRVPASFCGIYSHKPSLDLINLSGLQPGGEAGLPGFSTGLAVAGPMARSAPDLFVALKVLAGPEGYDRKAWSWTLPPPRQHTLKDFRVGYILDSPLASPTSEVRSVLDRAVSALKRTGAQLRPGWPPNYSLNEAFDNYMFLLGAFSFSTEDNEAQERDRKRYQQTQDPFAKGALSSYAEWQRRHFRQLTFRELWQQYFEQIDVFLMPCSFTVAFAHNHEGDMTTRSLDTPDGKRPYMQLMPWMVTATLTGCPATVAPIGQTSAGLPVGLQIMGPFWEDATLIEFATLLYDEIGGFKPPPGYSAEA
ncbi:MAG: amidase [Acidobacteriaceae bacterium]|nr:amidase [Acidobacteriaceae bacterium]